MSNPTTSTSGARIFDLKTSPLNSTVVEIDLLDVHEVQISITQDAWLAVAASSGTAETMLADDDQRFFMPGAGVYTYGCREMDELGQSLGVKADSATGTVSQLKIRV